MLRLALPVLAEQLLGVLVGFVDMALAGHVLKTDAHIAAMGSLAYLMWLLFTLFASVAIGATAVLALLTGGGEQSEAAHASNQALLLGVLLAAPITLLYGFGGTSLANVLQLEGEAAALAGRYLFIIAFSVPLVAVQRVGIASLRGAGETVSGFVAMTTVNILNAAISYGLVTGWGPLPNLGWDGLAIGTAASHFVGGVMIIACLLLGRAGLSLRWQGLRPDMAMIRRLLRIGIPGGVDSLAILMCHLWYLSIINALGTTAAAAHGLGVRIESLAYLPGTAFQVAAATLAGQCLGAGDPQRARHAVWTALVCGGVVMCLAGALFAFGGHWFMLLFLGTNGTDIAVVTRQLLKIVAVSMPAFAITMILTGGLRGAGDTRWPLAITFVGYLLVRIPGAYLLAWNALMIPGVEIPLPTGVHGAWIAMVVDTFVRAALVLARYWHGGWTRPQHYRLPHHLRRRGLCRHHCQPGGRARLLRHDDSLHGVPQRAGLPAVGPESSRRINRLLAAVQEQRV